MVRITGGRYRGRRLQVSRGVRPTTEVARKAVFDILGSRIAGATVLDACAGSGAYGLEALSRGAVRATFVESETRYGTLLRRNIETLSVAPQCVVEIRRVSGFAALAETGPSPLRFDVIFHDPPFEESSGHDLALLLGLLARGGTLVHERGDDLVPDVGSPPDDRRRYGRTRILFFERSPLGS